MELKWFDGLLVCSRPELLQRSLLHHQTRADFTVIRQKVEPMMAVICGRQANITVRKDHQDRIIHSKDTKYGILTEANEGSPKLSQSEVKTSSLPSLPSVKYLLSLWPL